MSSFEWNDKRSKAAILLAEGHLIDEVAEAVSVSSRTIDRWKSDIEFSAEVDRLSLMVGIASKAERLRIAKRTVRLLAKRQMPTHKDILEWLKYAQGETDGVKLDLTSLVDSIQSVAGRGQTGTDAEDDSATVPDV